MHNKHLTRRFPICQKGFLMNFDELSKLSFSNGEQLKRCVQQLAVQRGFKLFCKDSCSSNRLRFYCSKHQIHPNVKRSTKIECPFRLTFNKNINGIYILSPQSNLCHSHSLEYIQENELPEEIIYKIRTMKEIGISNYHIILYIEKNFQHLITSKDIAQIMQQKLAKENISETELMASFMEDKGKLLVFQNLDGIYGLLTITKEEEENLKRYGDFIVIDSSLISNFM